MKRPDMRFDLRTQKHRLRRAEYTPADLDEYLGSLPDEAEEATTTETRFTAHAREAGRKEE